MIRLTLYILIMLCASHSLHAQTPPKPPKKYISSDNFKERLASEKEKQKELESKMKALDKELKKTKDKLINIGESIQNNEKQLQKIELRTQELENENEVLEKKLKEDRISISKLLTALERIRRVPPQALIARPEAPLKTAQSAMLLSDIIPTLNRKAEALKNDLARQKEIAVALAHQRSDAERRAEDLKKEEKDLSALVSKREALYKKTKKDYKVREAEVQRISRSARNLKDLVTRLNRNEEDKQQSPNTQKAVYQAPVAMPPPGSARLPISGIIRTRYHDLDKFGAKSEGIRIEGRSGGLVVAPMSGIVRFSGSFKNYNNMVIIEHDDGYHSLIGGLDSVQARVDQAINAGEPIGKLKSTTNGVKPALYYELRFKGRAVNPSKKFSDLG